MILCEALMILAKTRTVACGGACEREWVPKIKSQHYKYSTWLAVYLQLCRFYYVKLVKVYFNSSYPPMIKRMWRPYIFLLGLIMHTSVMWCVYRTSCHGYPLFLYQEQRIMHLPKKEYRKHVTIVWYLLRVFWCLIKSELKSYDSTKNGSSIGQLKMEHFKVLLQKFTTPLHFKEMTGQACKGPWPCDTLYILKFLVISLQKVTTLLHLFV